MAGEPEAPGMGQALAVAEQEVGDRGEGRQRIQDRRDLAKRQQSGHVGKAGRPARHRVLERLEAREAQDHHGRPGDASAVLEADVDAGDPLDRTEPVAELRLVGEARLHVARLGWREVPGVLVDRDQRHGRRSPARAMTRSVSDQRPSPAISAKVNQRASAASLPARSSGPAARAT